jgi:hypothetical protein
MTAIASKGPSAAAIGAVVDGETVNGVARRHNISRSVSLRRRRLPVRDTGDDHEPPLRGSPVPTTGPIRPKPGPEPGGLEPQPAGMIVAAKTAAPSSP